MTDLCPRCNTPTHASESNDDGVCVACLGDDAILPDVSCDECGDVDPTVRHVDVRDRNGDVRINCNACLMCVPEPHDPKALQLIPVIH